MVGQEQKRYAPLRGVGEGRAAGGLRPHALCGGKIEGGGHGGLRMVVFAQTEARCIMICCRGTMMSGSLCGGGQGADQGRVKTTQPKANRRIESS